MLAVRYRYGFVTTGESWRMIKYDETSFVTIELLVLPIQWNGGGKAGVGCLWWNV